MILEEIEEVIKDKIKSYIKGNMKFIFESDIDADGNIKSITAKLLFDNEVISSDKVNL